MRVDATSSMKKGAWYWGRDMRLLIATCLMLVLAGCDFIYGVERDASLDNAPSLTCVEEVVRETPGIAKVERKNEEGGRPFTLTGIHAPDQNYYFIYQGAEGSHIWGALLISEHYDGTVQLLQDNERMNSKPPQEEIDASRPIMKKIEVALERNCSLSPSPLVVHEHCSGVECAPLNNVSNSRP